MLLAYCVLSAMAFAATSGSELATPPNPETRIIVGGDDANIRRFPYQVSLRVNGAHSCGAAVISANWLLTAAHCCEGRIPAQLSLRVGSSTRSSGGSIYYVQRIVVHENYDDYTMDNDICALKTSERMRLDRDVRAIKLAEVATKYPVGRSAIVTGWGRTQDSSSNKPSEVLQFVVLPFISEATCRGMYSAAGYGNFITSRQLCAGTKEGGKDSCQGDSGGPLTYKGRLAGIVSWGIGCANKLYPGVYTKVAEFRPWIKQATGL